MTISSTTNKVSYAGDAVTTVFAYDFIVPLITDMEVSLDGVVQVSGYTVNGAGNPAGGDVTFDTAPATDVAIVLLRSVPATQELDLRPYDAFPAESMEDALDKLTIITQDLEEQGDRSLTAPVDEDETVDLTWPKYQAGFGFQWSTEDPKVIELTDTPLGTIVTDAEAARDAAQVSAATASISEDNALASELRADDWANNPEDIPVTTGKFSAFHWSEKAKDFGQGIVNAIDVVYNDTITSWGVTEVQSALEFVEANFARSANVYLKSETYNNTEVYAKGETYTQAEVDGLVAATLVTAEDSAVALAIALGG